MLKGATDVIVKGGCFSEETSLDGILEKPLNILYGPNGSGKTTVSRCLASLTNHSDEYSAQLPNVDSQQLEDSVFVFNEDFVDRNVKIASDGLDPIIIFGKNIEIQGKEDELNQAIKEARDELERLKTARDETRDEISTVTSELENVLKDTYAETDKNIKGNTKKSPFKIDDFSDCESLSHDTDVDVLREQFIQDFSKFKTISSNGEIYWMRPVIPVTPAMVEHANEMLKRVLQKNEISERDEFIFKLANDHSLSHYIEKTQNDILRSSAERCPLCHQPISGKYRDELRHRLECVLNKEREEFLLKVEELRKGLTEISITLPDLPKGSCSEEQAVINANVLQLNVTIREMRESLSAKRDNLYESVGTVDLQKFLLKYEEIQKAINVVENAVSELNDIARNKTVTRKKLLEMNKQISYMENRMVFEELTRKKERLAKIDLDISRAENVLTGKEQQLQKLEMEKASTRIALDLINKCLAYVFYDDKRLYMEYENEKYVLKSNGKKVSPNKVSTGERNIIALSYFFTSIRKEKNDENEFSNPVLVVIDDPITSFDYGNRIGVFTLIKWQLTEVFKKSKDSKVLIMSHDQRTVADLFEIKKQIAYVLKEYDKKDEEMLKFFNLRTLKMEQNSPLSEYEVELQNIYDFAVSDKLDDKNVNVTIGNQMRRVLEHYAKIMNNSDYVKMACGKHYHINSVEQDSSDYESIVNSYIKNLSRMVINTESHSAGNDYDYFEQRFVPEELQKYAKYVLCFMRDTNESHLYAYMKKKRMNRIDEIHKELFDL